MKIGIPRGLLYLKYNEVIKTFLKELGADIISSPDTNKWMLDEGVKCCLDDTCLPMKIFHGHVSWLKDRCDVVFMPRLIGVRDYEFICPMFCGLTEMISNNIQPLPPLLDIPIFSLDGKKLSEWAVRAGNTITKDKNKIVAALDEALHRYADLKIGFNDEGYKIKVGLIGHSYNVLDRFVNMDIKSKLNGLGLGVITSDYIDRGSIDAAVERLFKKPFWTYARDYYGAAVNICNRGMAEGIIYLSSFSCGIDSVVTELIKTEIGDFPFMVLKLDEHTGEAGFDTRIEAFSDLLKRRHKVGIDIS